MAQYKYSSEQLQQIDQFDRSQAFEAGFAKAAQDLGLNEQEFAQFYNLGVQKIAEVTKAQPSK